MRKSKREKSTENKPPNAVLWLRVSTPGQVENNSLEIQEVACNKYCKENNLHVLKIFRGEGETAWSENRPEFHRMFQFLSENHLKIKALVCYDSSRFTRQIETYFVFKKLLDVLGISLESPSLLKSGSDSLDKLLENIQVAMDTFHSDTKSKESKRRMAARAEQGYWMGKPPIGYRVSKQRGVLETDPEAGPKVKKIFSMAASGKYSITELRECAEKEGLCQKSGNPVRQIKRMLQRPVYCGRIESTHWEGYVQSCFPSLIDLETYKATQRALGTFEAIPRRHRRDNPEFPLKIVLRCLHCSGNLTGGMSRGKSGAHYGNYWCGQCAKKNPKPRPIYFRRERVEQEFLKLLAIIQPNTEEITTLEFLIKKSIQESKLNRESMQKKYQSELRELNAQLARLKNDYRKNDLSAKQYSQFVDEITSSKERIQQRIDAFLCVSDAELEVVFTAVREVTQNLAFQWQYGNLESRKKIQLSVFPEGLVFDGEAFQKPQLAEFYSLFRENSTENYLRGRVSKTKKTMHLLTSSLPPDRALAVYEIKHQKTHEKHRFEHESEPICVILPENEIKHPQLKDTQPVTKKKRTKIKMASPRGFEPLSPP